MAKNKERPVERHMRITETLNEYLSQGLGCELTKIAASYSFQGLFPMQDSNFPLEKRQRDSAKYKTTANMLRKSRNHLEQALKLLSELPYPENQNANTELRYVSLAHHAAAVKGMIDSGGREKWENSGFAKFDNSTEHLIDVLARWETELERRPAQNRNERAFSTAKRFLAIYEHFSGRRASAGKDESGIPTGNYSRMLEKVFAIIEIDFGFYEPAREAVTLRDTDPLVLGVKRELERDFPINQ